ncbi:helix-turn-helix domain-containing protein [Streptomyces aidingensis]|uniref:Helix-turn-helix domain-containing protein n=1 Tax=Streptomyces aidingensis TaxID=910347 RepID=A0A1I1TV53_9ACTN|nr:helix-turn-helix transcriptional regulator [Streptomyces aidingensis]SFD62521.1 Helix-turn-helix domain-containing protein [Streptomyces aidingensis]
MAEPTVRRRRLGAALRRLREEAGLTLEEVEARAGHSPSKLSRIESAIRGIKAADLEELLDLYGAKEAQLRAFLSMLARDGNKRGWWQTYDLDPVYADLISLETDACAMSTYEVLVIPGLLQTAAYARAAIMANNMTSTPEEVSSLVDVRMARQSALTRAKPLKLRAIVHEAALWAGVPEPGVMRDQLQRLIDVTHNPHVTVQIMPKTAELHPGLIGGFTMLSFIQPGLDVVLLEHMDSSLYIEEAADVARYAEAFERLSASALPFGKSMALIREIKDAL